VELDRYIRVLTRRWWIILVAVVATAVSAVVFSRLQTPTYQSTAEVVVQPARADFGLTQTAKILLRSYMTVADSNYWAQDVIDRLRLDTTPQALRAQARFAAQDDRMVISIEVESTDGEEANRIARTWAELLQEWRNSENQRQRKEDRVDAFLRDEPAYSQSWPPRLPIMAAAGAIFGLILAVVIVFALEWIEAGVFLTSRDLEQSAGVIVLGTIPRMDSKARPARRSHGEKK